MIFKKVTLIIAATALLLSCNKLSKKDEKAEIKIAGTWQLVSGTTTTNGKSVTTGFTKDQKMIKIINETHFVFLKHKLNTPKDSTNGFDAGGGSYTLVGDKYTEHLDYYADKRWEGKTFYFIVTIKNDTLIQKGIEKLDDAGINREIIEKYVKVSK